MVQGCNSRCSIGTVYCWSYVSEGIAEQIGYTTKTVGWAFSLAILFLGLSAAFLGSVVEKDIHKVSAVFNAGGRLGFSAWADTMNDRNTIYKMIFILSIVFTGLVLVTNGIVDAGTNSALAILVICLVMVVNAGYGGGFSNVPTLLSDHYGMGSISAIHGITLSAWGFAGIAGPQLASFIIDHFGDKSIVIEFHGKAFYPDSMQKILIATLALYILSLVICFVFVKPTEKALQAKAAKKVNQK